MTLKKTNLSLGGPVLLFVSLLLLSGFSGCISDFWEGDDEEDTLVVAVNSLPETLDPAGAYDPVSLFVIGNVYETLVRYDGESVYNVVPGVAASWEIDDFYQTYTFYLKGNIKFSNGNLLTAEDVKYSLIRAMEMKLEPSWILRRVIDPSNITIGNYNPQHDQIQDIRITLKYPYRSFIRILAFPVASIVDKETVEMYGEHESGRETSWLNTHTVGSGPYTLDSIKSDKLVLKRNPYYHGEWEKKFVEKVEIRRYQSEGEKLEAMEKGEVDVAPLSISSFEEAKAISSVKIVEVESLRIGFIGFNTKKAPFNNTDIRKAFSLMLDFNRMVNEVLKSHGEREASIFPSKVGVPTSVTSPSYDPVEALNILENYYSVDDEMVQDFPAISAAYPVGNYLLENILMIYQENLASIGISLELRALNSTEYLNTLRNGESELFGMEWEPDYADPDAYAYPLLHSSSTDKANFAFYENATLDKKIEEAKKTFDPDTRNKRYGEIARVAVEEVPYLWLYSSKNLYASQTNVFGVVFNPIIQMNLYGTYIVT